MRPRLVVRFAIGGDLRFLSHHDVMRLFERALSRAQWPLWFTRGFNPRPRLSLPMPRSVGTASDDEWLVVDLDRPMDPVEAMEGLARQMPAGIVLHAVLPAEANARFQPLRARYQVTLDPVPDGLDEAITVFLGRETCPVLRDAREGHPARELDIRPFVEGLARDGERIEMVLRVTPQGTARPTEVLDSLGLPGVTLAHRIRRTCVEWSDDPFLSGDPQCKE